MIYFENGIDFRCREQSAPTVAKFKVSPGDIRYCVIGTQYGYIHTTGGDVRTWRTPSGAYRFLRNYVPL